MTSSRLKTGIIGFGLAGRIFHSTLLKDQPGFEIRKVMTSRTDEVRAFFGAGTGGSGGAGPQTVASAEEIFQDPEIDLVINCAPSGHHFDLTAAALKAGKHVVVEKPFVTRVKDGLELISLAEKRNRKLAVFQNRRWDADFLTVQTLIEAGRLGEIRQFESHFDRFRPQVSPDRWREKDVEGAGVLLDLAPHLIDQALCLFGVPESLTADIEMQRDGSVTDDYFHIVLHYGKMRAILHCSSFSDISPRFQVFGTKGDFVKHGLDPQEDQMKKGMGPGSSGWGIEHAGLSGALTSGEGSDRRTEQVTSMQGDYGKFYDQLHRSIVEENQPVPVSPLEALRVIQLIELARESAESGKVVAVPAHITG